MCSQNIQEGDERIFDISLNKNAELMDTQQRHMLNLILHLAFIYA